MELHFTAWDWGLLIVVAAMSTAIAWIRHPAWKAFVLALPFPFTLATLSLGGEVTASHFAGLVGLLGYMHGVRLLIRRAGWPAAPAIGICALAYSGMATLINSWIPQTAAAFWMAGFGAAGVGLGVFLRFPAPSEPGHRTSLPFWIKVPIIVVVILFLVVLKKRLGGFMATFPMVSVLGVYESRHSLSTTCRQTAWLVFGMAVMIAAIHLVQRVWTPSGSGAIGISFLAGWVVYLGLLAAATRGRWVFLPSDSGIGVRLFARRAFSVFGFLFSLAVVGLVRGEAPELRRLHFDGVGRIEGVSWEGMFLPIRSELRAVEPLWADTAGVRPLTVSNLVYQREPNGGEQWSGEWRLRDSAPLIYTQRVEAVSNGVRITLTVGALDDVVSEGVFIFLFLPVRLFSEEEAVFWRGPNVMSRTLFPAEPRALDEARFQVADGVDRVRVQSGPYALEIRLDRPRTLTLQDERAWGQSDYALYWPVVRGSQMKAGINVRLPLEIFLQGRPAVEPMRVNVREPPTSSQFEGFGGNFVYGLESPVATALVERLSPVRARLEMALHAWEPENDDASPQTSNWAYFETRDVEGSTLRRSFELAARLSRQNIPLALAVWDLPEWMYEGPPMGRWVSRRRIAPSQWPELLESVGTYLEHLKNRYGVEPELVSFNEPDKGVRVLLSSEEHRDAIRRMGEYFSVRGFRTRLVLGDTASARETASYGVYAVNDPVARRYLGAVSFHSWGGGTAADYAAWQGLARRIGKPLLVMEAGWDADAWRTPHVFEFPLYAIREVAHYLQLLAQAQPQSILIWEYTDDYPLLRTVPNETGTMRLEETLRFRFLEQLVKTTPRGAEILRVETERSDAAVALRGKGPEGRPRWVAHVVNHNAPRSLELTGAPPGWRYDGIVRTVGGAERRFSAGEAEGRITFEVPAWSLITVIGEPAEEAHGHGKALQLPKGSLLPEWKENMR